MFSSQFCSWSHIIFDQPWFFLFFVRHCVHRDRCREGLEERERKSTGLEGWRDSVSTYFACNPNVPAARELVFPTSGNGLAEGREKRGSFPGDGVISLYFFSSRRGDSGWRIKDDFQAQRLEIALSPELIPRAEWRTATFLRGLFRKPEIFRAS